MSSDLLWVKDRRIVSNFITPILTEGPITVYSVTKTLEIVNTLTELAVTFTTLNAIPANGIIRIFLPPGGFYLPLTGSVVCTDVLTSTVLTCITSLNAQTTQGTNYQTTQGINYIEIKNKCTTGCNAVTSMSFKFTNMLNPPSIKPIVNAFVIRTYTVNPYNIDLVAVSNAVGLTLVTAPYSVVSITSPASPIVTGLISTY